jgi:hypothetical protein
MDEKRRFATEPHPDDEALASSLLRWTVAGYGVAWPVLSVVCFRFMSKRDSLRVYSPWLRGAVATVVGFIPSNWAVDEIVE